MTLHLKIKLNMASFKYMNASMLKLKSLHGSSLESHINIHTLSGLHGSK